MALLSKRKVQKLLSLSLFELVLEVHICNYVLVSLHQPLGVTLPVFNLLYFLLLNVLYQELHLFLLLLFKLLLLDHGPFLSFLFDNVGFVLLLLHFDHPDLLSLLVLV